MSRAWYSKTVKEFLKDSDGSIVSELTKNHLKKFNKLMPRQRLAWIEQIKILQNELSNFPDGHVLFEYNIPRKGNRADIIFIHLGFVFVIEFKTGTNATKYANGEISLVNMEYTKANEIDSLWILVSGFLVFFM